ncbi:MAG: S8 family serine peptidase [Ardenticatenaceae bacterium]|nr:S8 family serine peptidase [Ardenticatenaceae bacterium]
MVQHRWKLIALLTLGFLLALAPAALAHTSPTQSSQASLFPRPVSIVDDRDESSTPRMSHRLIVELQSPSLVEWAASSMSAQSADPALFANGRLNVAAPSAQNYIRQLKAEQQAFVTAMTRAVPSAQVATFKDETGRLNAATYQIVMNAVAVDAGLTADVSALERRLSRIKDVKHVYRDYAHQPDLYASVPLINAAAAWNNAAIGGMENAGAGIKVASMDGGIHKDAPMFDGTGYSYPAGYPLGDGRNNNGKIIASRAYFRTWDPPSAGDENPWPGTNGTSHGVHTASIAAGDPVVASYLGITETISGVAPHAYVMSYRVFYNSITNDGSFYNVEGIAALEDIVADGADVLNNSWGGGPGSTGGEFDPLDRALINAANAGVFVSMSNGNAGPGRGTSDHPSSDYINVAASTTTGTLAAGRLEVTAPEPVSDTLQAIPIAGSTFGAPLPLATIVGPYPFVTAASLGSATACGDPNTANPFPPGSLTDKAVIIRRGSCEFGQKVLNAERAGAIFAVVYNNAGDGLISMAPGEWGGQVTIPSIFIGQSNGEAVVAWYDAHGDDSQFQVNTIAFQIGNTPDLIANFSSRGPGVGNVLKPDIAAPGVNILAQGFTPGATGEARHLGYGQASGTSMAAPHVTGAAALLKQIHPTWSNAWIKSALMSSSKYIGIYNEDASPAQPLDMGAGRLDLTNAADPGIILDPPGLSFGQVMSGTTASLNVRLTSVAAASETYDVTTLYTGSGFDATTAVAGMTVTPSSVTLAPGHSTTIRVEWDTAASMGYGDNQGFVVFTGSQHNAHMPAWIRVGYESQGADVLIIDNDASSSVGLPDYTPYYTSTLETLGYSYEVWDADANYGHAATIPDATFLDRYPTIIYQTGDNFYPNGSFTVATAPTTFDMDRLVEYVNNGGHLIAFGQDLSSATGGSSNPPFFYGAVLGAGYLQDSVNDEKVFTDTAQLLVGLPGTAFSSLSLDISARGDGAGNQAYIDEVNVACVDPGAPAPGCDPYEPVMKYSVGDNYVEDGYIALGHRDQPTLERPGTTLAGRALYFTLGLEGINSDTGYNTRGDLLGTALDWALDQATVTITPTVNPAGRVSYFMAGLESSVGAEGATYRWDFGDGSHYSPTTGSATAGHTYSAAGIYTVRVEATDSLGTRVIGETEVMVGYGVYVPIVMMNGMMPATPTAFEAALSGANEVPPVTTEASGQATFAYDPTTRELDYTLEVWGISQAGITAAHIHRGAAGSNGGVAYTLYTGDGSLFPGHPISGSVTLSEEDAARLTSAGLYVNVHTTDHPGGAIRGQIMP